MFLFLLLCFPGSFAKDYCAHEYFNPECRQDEIVVMERATYGRTNTGNCLMILNDAPLINDPMYIGCEANVLDIMDRFCSGHQNCNVQVIFPELVKKSKCYKDLVHFLRADYSCLSVTSIDRTCSITVTNSVANLLIKSKTSNDQRFCGGKDNPWTIEAAQGQNIIASMLIFEGQSTNITDDDVKRMDINQCKMASDQSNILGVFIEPGIDSVFAPFCDVRKRSSHVYTSRGNKIVIEINQNVNARYLLNFEATGCYDLKPPQDAWMKREGNEITVGCYMNRHTWKLVCNGRNWVGVIGNCTQQSSEFEKEYLVKTDVVEKPSTFDPKQAFLIVVLLCTLFIIGIIFICICILCYQKFILSKKDIYGLNHSGLSGNYNDVVENGRNNIPVQHNKLISDDDYKHDPCYFVLEDENEKKNKEEI